MSQVKLLHSGGNGVIVAAPASNPASDITFKLPQADGSANQVLKTDGSGNLSFVAQPTGGLEMADQWRITSNFSFATGVNVLNANWERVDTNGYGQLGTGMTESSGVFTFPSTGIYKIDFRASGAIATATNYYCGQIRVSIDSGSNFTEAASQCDSSSSNNHNASVNVQHIFDVTNTSTHKVCFAGVAGNNSVFDSSSSLSYTNALFMKLGDT